jgi:hemerythrin
MSNEPPANQDAASVDRIIQAYSRFVPHQFLELMGKESITDIQPGDSIETRMTLLFADIRDFTALSETMTPRQNFSFINSYLAQMEPIIGQFHGVIDKFIGDSIMALFATSADDALDAAIAMHEALRVYNQERGQAERPAIAIGIGLNTGLSMLGTVGDKSRMDGTVISDAVNLASRIESMTKDYGVGLLISEHTYYSLKKPDTYHIRFADRVRVKGKEQPQSVYEVFDIDPPDVRQAKQATKRIFEEALAAYHFKEVPKAMELLTRCLEACPEDRSARVYLKRCQNFLETGVHEGTGEVDLSVEWGPHIEIGHALIDEQHRELFRCINEFVEAIRTCRTSSQVDDVINFLDTYVHEHFKSEEEAMEEHGYPFLKEQKEQHERFSTYFASLKEEISKDLDHNRQFLLFKIQVFVMDWLVNHTVKLDRHFGKFMRLQKMDH